MHQHLPNGTRGSQHEHAIKTWPNGARARDTCLFNDLDHLPPTGISDGTQLGLLAGSFLPDG